MSKELEKISNKDLVRHLMSESWVSGSNDTDYDSIYEPVLLLRLEQGEEAIELVEKLIKDRPQNSRNERIELLNCSLDNYENYKEGRKL